LQIDKPRSNCGVFGIYNSTNAAVNVYYGLHALQHRGQEAAGIVSIEKKEDGKPHIYQTKGLGLVSEVFANPKIFDQLKGTAAIGHNRYSTTGAANAAKNIQPFIVNYRMGHLAISHNGNLTNARIIREKLVNEGAIFQTSSDTEVILHLIARSRLENQVDQIRDALKQVEGAYSINLLTDTKLVGARDPYGIRPLCIGKLNGSYIITSETCALDILSAEYIREVEPGEIVVIDDEVCKTGKIKSYKILDADREKKHCVFEYIYFSRPDSKIFGSNVDKMRRKLGKVLATHHPVKDKDGEKVIVMSVPDSSNTAAIGYENQLTKMGIPSKLEIGLIRSHYIGRTFILPGQAKREVGVRIKFNTVKGVLEDRTVVIIDDSIVRGTTSKQLVKLIREAGPKEIHLRISSPPILFPCHYGMDFPSKNELIANKFENIDKIREHLDVDSLAYLTHDQMLEAMVDHTPDSFCTACFSGNYPVPIDEEFLKEFYDE
jgi:amidophosphoribosyltransferase